MPQEMEAGDGKDASSNLSSAVLHPIKVDLTSLKDLDTSVEGVHDLLSLHSASSLADQDGEDASDAQGAGATSATSGTFSSPAAGGGAGSPPSPAAFHKPLFRHACLYKYERQQPSRKERDRSRRIDREAKALQRMRDDEANLSGCRGTGTARRPPRYLRMPPPPRSLLSSLYGGSSTSGCVAERQSNRSPAQPILRDAAAHGKRDGDEGKRDGISGKHEASTVYVIRNVVRLWRLRQVRVFFFLSFVFRLLLLRGQLYSC